MLQPVGMTEIKLMRTEVDKYVATLHSAAIMLNVTDVMYTSRLVHVCCDGATILMRVLMWHYR